MAKTRRKYKGNAVSTTISSGLSAGATNATISASTGWPSSGPFYAVIDPGTSTEEKVLVGTISGTSLSNITRGVDDTSDVSHTSGCTIYPVFTAVDADEANELTSSYAHQGAIVYQGASTFSELQIGTAGQVLKVNSGATAPEWGQVPTAGIADTAVTTAKIADANVTADKLASDSVTTAKIADDAVTANEIADAAVNSNHIAAAAVTKAKLNDGASGDVPLVTVSAYSPSGGKNGDVWFVV